MSGAGLMYRVMHQLLSSYYQLILLTLAYVFFAKYHGRIMSIPLEIGYKRLYQRV